MNIDRRHLALAGAVALGASTLLRNAPALAASADETAVSDAVEALRKAVFDSDKGKLTALTAEQLTYGHSDGRVQNQAEFINGVMTRKPKLNALTFPELKVAVTGDTAVARHLYVQQSELEGKTTDIKIGVLAVWQKQGAGWKLLARQAYKLT